jgi:aldehyde dehydrogenase (NAD+)
MLRKTDFFIDGKWVAPTVAKELDVINPADEQPFAVISLGSAADVDKAVAAAQRAFPAWSATSREQRIALLEKLLAAYNRRVRDMAQAISWEMGAPIKLALEQQAASGSGHIKSFIEVLKSFEFEEPLNDKNPQERIVREPIGVCGLITPWNWPMNQVALKVVPALAAGCTVVLKPSEIAPMSSIVFAEMMEEAGFPAGVFNMVNGDGPTVGEAMSRHPGIDMMSFTGSTRAGVAVTKASAETVKRVALELGGKSPNIVFDDADLTDAVTRGLAHCFENTGQSCNAPTRMLVQRPVYAKAVDIAAKYAATVKVGNPAEDGDHIGPLSSDVQFEKVQGMIDAGIKEGARVVAGGLGRPRRFQPRLLCTPDGVCRRQQRHAHRPRGDFRPCRGDDPVRNGRGSHRHRQRYALRPVGLCPDRRQGARPTRGAQAPCRHGADQRHRPPLWQPLRRLQAVRPRPRGRQMGHRGFPRGQGDQRVRGRSGLISFRLKRFPLSVSPRCGGEEPKFLRGRTLPVQASQFG